MESTMREPAATIFDIKRFAIHDGDGIRTTVFFKGCPLHCIWCHNPESISFLPELQWVAGKCIGCGECGALCPHGAHVMTETGHGYHRMVCERCFRCVETCPAEALIQCGRVMSVKEVLDLVMEDEAFYRRSNGGVTLSGGECLCQADFCTALLQELKARYIHTAVDTSGYVPRAELDKVIPFTDIFLYDVKHIDSTLHKKYTGVPNEEILENLKYLHEKHKPVEIRIPLIPTVNDAPDVLHAIGAFLRGMDNIKAVRILPYNNLAGSKYEMIGRGNTQPKVVPPSQRKLDSVRSLLAEYGLTVL